MGLFKIILEYLGPIHLALNYKMTVKTLPHPKSQKVLWAADVLFLPRILVTYGNFTHLNQNKFIWQLLLLLRCTDVKCQTY